MRQKSRSIDNNSRSTFPSSPSLIICGTDLLLHNIVSLSVELYALLFSNAISSIVQHRRKGRTRKRKWNRYVVVVIQLFWFDLLLALGSSRKTGWRNRKDFGSSQSQHRYFFYYYYYLRSSISSGLCYFGWHFATRICHGLSYLDRGGHKMSCPGVSVYTKGAKKGIQ